MRRKLLFLFSSIQRSLVKSVDVVPREELPIVAGEEDIGAPTSFDVGEPTLVTVAGRYELNPRDPKCGIEIGVPHAPRSDL